MIDVFDGHNDLPWHLRETRDYSVDDLNNEKVSPFTTIAQLHKGGVSKQFWSVFVHSDIIGDEAIRATLEQIDCVHRLIDAYPDDLVFTPTAELVRSVHGTGRVASLLGVEGGQQINESLATLRMYARLGVRYMTLTWSTTTTWADSATDEPQHGGLSEFGREVVREMDRIGMIPDLSHVAPSVMHQTLDIAAKPVIFSHSCVYDINPHPRNVPTDVIDRLPDNGGVLMITFVPSFVSSDRRQWVLDGEHGTPPEVTVAQVADHCDWVRERVGIDHLGIGSDLCGTDSMPNGLSNAAEYPNLFAELRSRGWSEDDLATIGYQNVMRVLDAYEDSYTAFLHEQRPA